MTTSSSTPIDARLRHYQPPRLRWTAWQFNEPVLRGFDYPAIRTTLLDRSCPPERKDIVLLALIRQARRDDEAALCVIACLYPGLSRISHRYRDFLDRDEAWANVTTAALSWIRKRGPREPRFVALSLLRDCSKELLRAVQRERCWRERVILDDALILRRPQPNDVEPSRLVTARGAGNLTPIDLALIKATRLDGVRLVDAAMLLGISYEAAKKRRRRAEVTWARHLRTAADITRRRGPAVSNLAA